MKTTRYILLLLLLISILSCNEEDTILPKEVVLPELTAGTADFSNYVAIGASFTAGFTDGALFIASQENSFPNMLVKEFEKVGGDDFTQPLMNDNIGGISINGVQIPGAFTAPRLVFGGSGPIPLATALGRPVLSTTDLARNNLIGPFNNMGVPGAKSYHLLFNGYGNIANLATKTANPYFVRMASSPTATMLGDAMSQNPTFFTLSEIGGNDVLGYALSGAESNTSSPDYNPITPSAGAIGVGFDATLAAIVNTLTSNGAKGVITNVPYVSSLPHFTTVPYNPVPLDAGTAAALNQGYAPYNGGLQQAFAALNGTGLFTAAEVAKRTINFSSGPANAMVIIDETLTDLGAINSAFAGIPKYRQATAADLFVLPLASLIPQGYGTQIPLADKWVLIPSEQLEIKNATDAYNITISNIASAKGLALVDLKGILQQASTTGISDGSFTFTAKLVTGGLVGLDGFHLTARGYAAMANKFLEAIDVTYGSNFIAAGSKLNVGDYPTNYSKDLQ